MGFLQQDTNNIILDAVLTNKGREKLARNDGSFRIVAFSLSDDEVDYSIITKFGRNVGREKIEKNTPVFEALTNGNLETRSRLITISDPTKIALSTYSVTSGETYTFNSVIGSAIEAQSVNVEQTGPGGQSIPQEIQDSVVVVSMDRRFMRIRSEVPFQTVENVDYYNVTISNQEGNNQSTFNFQVRPKRLLDQDFTTFGNSSNKTQISTFARIQGRQSGLTKDLRITLNKNAS